MQIPPRTDSSLWHICGWELGERLRSLNEGAWAVIGQGLRSIRDRGWRATAKSASLMIAQRRLGVRPDLVQHRYALSQQLARELDFTIRYGPFAGTRLPSDGRWSGADLGSMLLGMYEFEILEVLVPLAIRCDVFVDVGAADGYYAVGSVHAGLFREAVCFEMDFSGRQVIRDHARRNGVEERISIHGEADAGFLDLLETTHEIDLSRALFLFDIEGGEFELLNESHLERIARSHVIVEMHAFSEDEARKAHTLSERLESHFDVEYITQGARDPNIFPELTEWCDDDRWLLCSESRAKKMTWAVCRPRDHIA